MTAAKPKFVEGNLFRHVAVMSLTGSVGLMAVFVAELATMLFISMLARPELTAAIGFGGTVMFFLISVGIGISVAAGALVAVAIGRRDETAARFANTHSTILALVIGSIVSFAFWLFLDPLVSLLGATGEVHAQAVHFLELTMISNPLLMVGMVGGAVLRSYGDARRSMTSTLVGAGVSFALNPLFILGLDLGLTGAGIATIITRLTIAVVAIWQVQRVYKSFVPTSLAAVIADLRPISRIAVPAVLAQVATPLGYAIVTRFMAAYGEEAVAGMAITGRITPVAFGVIFALAGSIGPIVGQNYGARLPERVKGAFNASMLFSALVIAVVSALLFVLRGPISDAFHAEGLTREIIYLFCGPLAILWFFVAVIFVSNSVYNNLGKPGTSTWTNWLRATIGTLIPVWIGAELGGAIGVMWGQAITGVIFGILSWWLAIVMIRKLDALQAPVDAPKK